MFANFLRVFTVTAVVRWPRKAISLNWPLCFGLRTTEISRKGLHCPRPPRSPSTWPLLNEWRRCTQDEGTTIWMDRVVLSSGMRCKAWTMQTKEAKQKLSLMQSCLATRTLWAQYVNRGLANLNNNNEKRQSMPCFFIFFGSFANSTQSRLRKKIRWSQSPLKTGAYLTNLPSCVQIVVLRRHFSRFNNENNKKFLLRFLNAAQSKRESLDKFLGRGHNSILIHFYCRSKQEVRRPCVHFLDSQPRRRSAMTLFRRVSSSVDVDKCGFLELFCASLVLEHVSVDQGQGTFIVGARFCTWWFGSF